MNFEVDDLLDHVDEWKFKLHEKLKNRTPKQRAEFWRQSRQRARALGLTVPETEQPAKRPVERGTTATLPAGAHQPNEADDANSPRLHDSVEASRRSRGRSA